MPRIRTIKPEFWDSPGTARASLRARLFYIAMWNWADDYGVGTANPKQLIGFAFPNDDDVTVAEFPRLRTEVSECFGTVFYEVRGRAYYAIPAWDEHQKNERRAQGKYPGPDQAEHVITEMHGSSVQSDGSSGTGTGEQGNRGTEDLSSTAARRTRSTPAKTDEDFEAFWGIYPRREAKKEALKAWAKAKKDVAPARIIVGARRYAEDPNREKQFTKLPATWLNAGCWDDDPLPERVGPNGQTPGLAPQRSPWDRGPV